MSIVNTTVPVTSRSANEMIDRLLETYPFLRSELLTRTAYDRPIRTLVAGTGSRKVLFTAAHHANEWITALVLLKFCEDLSDAWVRGTTLDGTNVRQLLENVTIYMVPMMDPDGVDLVVGAIGPGDPQYEAAVAIAARYPDVPFPDGWKANLLGTDLNVNYPAEWLKAREIKFSLGYTTPAPKNYVGRAPLDQLETRALYEYTQVVDPALVLAFHSQGSEIYWQFQDYQVPGARELGERLAQVSGYPLADTPFDSSFAGYKDWFIQQYLRPGYTIEVGLGVNPLPITQFDDIYRACRPLCVEAAKG